MRDIFSPIFILSLAALFLARDLGPAPFVFRPLALALFALFLLLFHFRKYRPAYALAAAALALLLCGSFLERQGAHAAGRELRLPAGEYVVMRGALAAFPEIGNGRSALTLRARSFAWGGRRLERELNVRVTVGGDCRRLRRGDRVEVAARVGAAAPARNFFPSPYENYLLVENVHLTAFCKSAQLVQVTGRANFFWRFIGAWRERIRARIEARYLAAGRLRPPGVFLEATLLGDRGRLENAEQEALIGSGALHLLAISGANIAMLALLSLLLLRALRFSLRGRLAATALLLLLFLTVSGFDVSALRAVLMALLLFAARAWFIDAEPANIVSFCGLLLLAANPARFLDPGFVLTFALTAAILAGRRLLLPRLKALPRWAAELLAASASASLLALPLSLFFFQRYAFSGLLSGLLLAPLAAGVTACGAALLFLAWLPLPAAALALAPAGALLALFFGISGWFGGHLSLTILRPSPPWPLAAAACLLFYALALERLRPRGRAALALLLAALLCYMAFPAAPYRPGRLEVYFLDVGHGDAEVVVFPGGDALLVDGGGSSFSDFQVGRRLVLPFIVQKRIHVRWAAASHCHPDHAEGLAEILPILKPEELWIASAAVKDPYFLGLIAAKPPQTRLRRIARGFRRDVGGAAIACLAPPGFIEAAAAENNHSMVLRVAQGDFAVLLTGDIEKEPESDLAAAFGAGLSSAVLKIAHHGSRTSSGAPFLDQVRPRVAVISAPAYSSYGFPHPEVLGRLKKRGIRWLTTARSGGVMVAPAPAGLEIRVSK